MGARRLVIALTALLIWAPAAQAETFSLGHSHSGALDAQAEGDVTFPDAGGANVNVTVSDRNEDGWCAQAWVTSNLPPATQKTFRVCGVGKQQTFSLPLPGGARCNISFVEVTVGRVDPSDNDKTELGDASRMPNPCPPLVQPAPPPPPPPVGAHVNWSWVANHRWTRNAGLTVSDVPAGAAVTLSCRGHGCPRRKAVAVSNGRADVHRLLGKRHLKPGAKLELRVTRADMIGKVVQFRIRRGHSPAAATLCLPPGAVGPARC